MKKKLLFNLCIFIAISSFANGANVDSITFENGLTIRNKIIYCDNDFSDSIGSCIFQFKGSLYIASNAINEECRKFIYKMPSTIDLMKALMSLYRDEGDCDKGCGLGLLYDGNTPTTLTLVSDLDTIQYTTTPYPNLYAAIIRDTLFGFSAIKCGTPVNELMHKLHLNEIPVDFSKYNKIVLLPQYYGLNINKMDISSIIVLYFTKGILRKIEFRNAAYFHNGKIIKDELFYNKEAYYDNFPH